MSNRVTIIATKFINLDEEIDTDEDGDKVGASFGYRVFDDMGMTYSNGLSEEEACLPDLELLVLICERFGCGQLGDFLEFVIKDKQGMEINGAWYDWDQIKSILLPEETG